MFSTQRHRLYCLVAVLVVVLCLTGAWAFGLLGDSGTVKVPLDGTFTSANVAGYVMSFVYNPVTAAVTVTTSGGWGRVQFMQFADMTIVGGTHYVRFTYKGVSVSFVKVHWVKKRVVA